MSSDDVLAERPVVAGAVLLALVFALSSGLQYVLEGGVDVPRAALFALAFSATYMGFYLLRQRRETED